jgi:hypothetical protein
MEIEKEKRKIEFWENESFETREGQTPGIAFSMQEVE